jgi:hypothetical protein
MIINLDPELIRVDKFIILKRVLLKKTIFGVDLSIFAIELAYLRFWIDTFIFSTPLSFIEHHIKHGNSLITGWMYAILQMKLILKEYAQSKEYTMLFLNITTLSAPHTGITQYRRPTVKEHDHHWASQQDSFQ